MNEKVKGTFKWVGTTFAAFLAYRYLSPLWEVIESGVLNFLLSISGTYSNWFYQQLGQASDTDFDSKLIVVGICLGFTVFIPVYLNDKERSYLKQEWIEAYAFFCLMFFLFTAFQFQFLDKGKKRFQNALTIIAPHVDDIEIKKLKSQWVQMERREDFDRIKNRIDSITTKYLPNRVID